MNIKKIIGESTGNLTFVLESIHAHLEKQLETQEEILREIKKYRKV